MTDPSDAALPCSPPRTSAGKSPYKTAEEARDYLRLRSVKALYRLVERGVLTPLPGTRTYRFTEAMLDAFVRGETKAKKRRGAKSTKGANNA